MTMPAAVHSNLGVLLSSRQETFEVLPAPGKQTSAFGDVLDLALTKRPVKAAIIVSLLPAVRVAAWEARPTLLACYASA